MATRNLEGDGCLGIRVSECEFSVLEKSRRKKQMRKRGERKLKKSAMIMNAT